MASGSRYVAVAMVVNVGVPWLPPQHTCLTHPASWKLLDVARRIFHETVHYWQFIAHTALIRLVEEDWARLQRFQATGVVEPAGPLRRAFRTPDALAGFSPEDLMECLARVWDVHTLGPPNLIELELADSKRDIGGVITRAQYEQLKADGQIWHHYNEEGNGEGYSSLSFDIAMRAAAGRYALPYLAARDATNELVAGALFPLCGHFALHAQAPVAFYLELFDRVQKQVDFPRGATIESAWRHFYPLALKEALLLHVERHGSEFFTGQAVIHDSPLYNEHAGYRLAHTLLSSGCDHIAATRDAQFLIGPEAMPLDMRALWTMDFLLGCCGMTDSRTPDLLAHLAPPVIRFEDGRAWAIGTQFDQLKREVFWFREWPSPPRQELVAPLLAVNEQWQAMQWQAAGL